MLSMQWLGSKRLMRRTYAHPAFVMDFASRSLLERCARHLLLNQHLNVELRTGTKVMALLWDDEGSAVTGMHA